MLLKTSGHRGILSQRRGRLIDNNDIESDKFLLVLPKRFTNHSFNSVSPCRFPAMLLGNSQPESGRFFSALAAKYCKKFVAATGRFFEHAPKSGGIQ